MIPTRSSSSRGTAALAVAAALALGIAATPVQSQTRPAAEKLPPAAAQPPSTSVFIEELTWTEVRDGLKAGKTTVIVPTGGTEQGGPHVILGKENYVITYCAGEIARRLANSYVAPTLAYVPEGNVEPPSGHMRYPGSITLPEDVFVQVLVWAGRSFKVTGFKDVVFIGNSGGNQAGMKAAVDQLNKEFAGSGVRAHFVGEYYYATAPEGRELSAFDRWIIEQGVPENEVGSHVGVRDTSTLMAVEALKFKKGELVRWDKIVNGGGFAGSGVTGNPEYANVAFGDHGLKLKIDATVAKIREVTARR